MTMPVNDDVLLDPARILTDIQNAKSPEEALDLVADYFERRPNKHWPGWPDVARAIREQLLEWNK